MGVNLIHNTLVLEAVKDNEHFLLVYPNTPAGRLEAKRAVQTWLLNCELDFNRQDAEQFWRAIDTRRLSARFDRQGGVQRDMRRWR